MMHGEGDRRQHQDRAKPFALQTDRLEEERDKRDLGRNGDKADQILPGPNRHTRDVFGIGTRIQFSTHRRIVSPTPACPLYFVNGTLVTVQRAMLPLSNFSANNQNDSVSC